MTPKLYQLLEPLVTVYSGQASPYGPVADPLIQQILKSDPAFADAEPEELEEPTPDGGLASPQISDGPLALSEDGTDARSPVSIFTIHAEARIEGGGIFARKAVLRVGARRGRAFRVFAWQPVPVVLFPALDAAEADAAGEE